MPYASSAHDNEAPTVGIEFVRLHLGRCNYGQRRLCSYIQLLVDQCGFPPPLPSLAQFRRKDGTKGAALPDELEHKVCMDSVWRREAVLVWLDDYTPPDVAAAIDARDRRQAADEMDRAAFNLRLVG